MRSENDMYPEDLERVKDVVNSGINSVERKPFRPLRLLLVLWSVVSLLGVIAWWFGRIYGLV